MNISGLNLNLFKAKKELLTLNQFTFLPSIKTKFFKDLLMFQVILLLIELLFNPFLKLFVKKFKFKILMKSEKSFNLYIDLSKKLITIKYKMYKYLLIMFIDKMYTNLWSREKMLILEFWIHHLKFIMEILKLYLKKLKNILLQNRLLYLEELLLIKQLNTQLLLTSKFNYNSKTKLLFIEIVH